jgi:diketogulonate reductase-like aldo/keto reductase
VVASGKIRYIGFCNVPAWVAAQSQTIAHFRGWAPLTALQFEYSLLERTPEGELMPMAEALGLGILSWSPLRGGLLSGRYVRDGVTPADSLRSGRLNRPTQRDWDVIDALAQVAAAIGASSAEVALAWVRNHPSVIATLIGVRTPEQLHVNVASLEITLTPEQLNALDEPSAPALGFPAAITAGPGPMLGFGGTKVDGSNSRCGRCCSPAQPATESAPAHAQVQHGRVVKVWGFGLATDTRGRRHLQCGRRWPDGGGW